jgi:hypothetical protein
VNDDIKTEIAALRAMKVPALVDRYLAVFGKPPRIKHCEWLWKRIAWKIQEQRFGGLSDVAKRRLEELIAEIKLPSEEKTRTVTGKLKSPGKPNEPSIGTTLVKQWRGREIRLQVVDGGYELEGVVHRTLSAAAQAITGQHWNGKLFFGLAKRKAAR